MKNKSFILKRLLLTFAVSITAFLSLSKEVRADSHVYIDTDNNFVFETDDKKKTSDIYYQTDYITMSRCVYDPAKKELHATKEHVDIKFDQNQIDQSEYKMGGITFIHAIFKIPVTSLLGGASAEWRKEIEDAISGDGPPVYVRFDGVMSVWHGDKLWSAPYPNYGPFDGQNPAQIQAAEAWANPRGLASHYNQYWMIGNSKAKEPEIIEEDEANVLISKESTYAETGSIRPAPSYSSGNTKYHNLEFATGNYSPDGYDLAEGIPSSKDVTNRSYASSWCGETEVWARTVTTEQYKGIEYKFNWTLEGEADVPDEDNSGNPVINPATGKVQTHKEATFTPQEPFEGTFDEHIQETTSMVPAVAFNYLVNAEFYDLAMMGVYNMAFPGAINYDSAVEVPMSAITTADYVDIAAEGTKEISSWFADSDMHVEWGELDTSPREVDLGTFESYEDAKDAMEEMFVELKTQMQETVFNGTVTKNDYLMIDGKEYMKVYEGPGVNWTEDGELPPWTFCTESAANKEKFEVNSISDAEIPREFEGEEQTVTIPSDTDNGKYPTGAEVAYTRKIQYDSRPKFFYTDSQGEWFSEKENYEPLQSGHCLDPSNGYIHVHTPVISPVEILDDQGQPVGINTQLVAEATNPNATYQLLLDEDYILDWESEIHRGIPLYGDSGKYSKYDEFVEKKWMMFPFDVEYNGKYYNAYEHSEPDEGGDGWSINGKYTDWILIESPSTWDADVNFVPGSDSNGWAPSSSNHWRQTPIYIPSYAEEVGGWNKDAYIYYKVEAINTDGRYGGDHTQEQERLFNKNYTYEYADDGAKYVATYKIQVQTSGIIYDFMITGTSDKDAFMYSKDDQGQVGRSAVPFCTYKQEHRVGTKNRFGESAVRYRADGSLNRNWDPVNTIALMRGKSQSFSEMGYVRRGSSFSFSLKTIANLWSEGTDSIEITPSFRYIRPDGTSTKRIKVYYKNNESGDDYIEYGSERDRLSENTRSVQLINTQFDDSYYDELNSWLIAGQGVDKQIGDWVNYTVKIHNDVTGDDQTVQEFMNHKEPSYNLSSIVLNSKLRMLSGEWEQLKRNTRGMGREHTGILRYPDKAYTEFNRETGYEDTGLSNWDYTLNERFKQSMQTWYGQYYVPSYLYIIDLDEKGLSDDFDLKKYVDDKLKTDPDFHGFEDLDLFLPNDGYGGYLIINFDIRTKNEGKPHLQYSGGNNGRNMWQTEGFVRTVDIGEKIGPEGLHTITLEYGDVAIVDLSYDVKNKYKAAIFNIN